MKNLEVMVLYYRYKRGGVMCCHDDITSPSPFRKIPLKQRKALLVSSHLCSRHSTSRACKMHASSMSGGSVELDRKRESSIKCCKKRPTGGSSNVSSSTGTPGVTDDTFTVQMSLMFIDSLGLASVKLKLAFPF